jgi:hypothetical protein
MTIEFSPNGHKLEEAEEVNPPVRYIHLKGIVMIQMLLHRVATPDASDETRNDIRSRIALPANEKKELMN